MSRQKSKWFSRRALLTATGAAAASALLPRRAFPASKAKIRIGLLLPYSGTYAALGNNITDAMKLAAREHDNKLAGREIEWVAVDDESDPAKA
ncbi:MAG TPA: ABC transporter substrate-binding protein, partial [Myxococcales bacterium]